MVRIALVVALAGVAAHLAPELSHASDGPRPRPTQPAPPPTTAPKTPKAEDSRPNVIFVLADDLSWDLVRFMPHVRQMQREGATFSNYFVTDSLCCPSRASIFTGRFPHNHGVLTNTPPSGGFAAFRRGAQSRTFATELQGSGYRTAMMGKYFNGYHTLTGYIPPGWSNWQVSGSAYRGFDYTLSENGHTARFGDRPQDYLTDVLARRGKGFVSRMHRSGGPFFLEVATFAPHHPFTPAPRHASAYPFLTTPRTAAFDRENRFAPDWLRDRPPLTPLQIAELDLTFRKRAQSVLSLDGMIGTLRAALRRSGLARNTYVVFSSDNGFHLGEHRLLSGKMTAFDSDIRVPLIVVGPGVVPGSTIDELTENVDLAPTFMRLGGVTPPRSVDGRSLVPLLRGKHPRAWRQSVLIEHHHPPTPEGDPDRQTFRSGNPPSYEAIRTRDETYVEYENGEREYYDLRRDPDQLVNRYGALSQERADALHAAIRGLSRCRGEGCWLTSLL
jgi:N-acetylglucosamine-6-sulfatase